MVLQSSGVISFSDIIAEFGSSFNNMAALYGIAAGVPTTNTISFFNMYGKAASVPSISSIPNQVIDTASGAVSTSVNTSSYVSDTYGVPLTFQYVSVTSGYTSGNPSMNASTGVLSYTILSNKWGNLAYINFSVMNRFGKTSNGSVPLLIKSTPPTSTSMGTAYLTNNSVTRTLSQYITDVSGSTITYSLTANPKSNASINASNVLTITGAHRNTSYTVTVTATNGYGQSVTTSIVITESGPPVCAAIGGRYNTTYFNNAPNVFYQPGDVTMNVYTGQGSANNNDGGVTTLTYTGFNTFYAAQWEGGLTLTYNGVDTLSISNGSTWKR